VKKYEREEKKMENIKRWEEEIFDIIREIIIERVLEEEY